MSYGDTRSSGCLRDVLGMTGTKFGCGMALCGACTVHIDGVATRSCITSIDSVGKSEITTIEAIGATATGAKIQKAWLDREVVQCGYCQSGQIMSASALLASNRIQRIPISTPRCPATSVAADLSSAFAKRSSRPRNRAGQEADMTRSLSPRDRRIESPSQVPPAGAAAAGGLLLSFALPFANGEAEAAGADRFAPNAFIRIGAMGRSS
jgi:aerobic-type carbon monoxide dehydrogenase small subunit (CoxS/CutS family)